MAFPCKRFDFPQIEERSCSVRQACSEPLTTQKQAMKLLLAILRRYFIQFICPMKYFKIFLVLSCYSRLLATISIGQLQAMAQPWVELHARISQLLVPGNDRPVPAPQVTTSYRYRRQVSAPQVTKSYRYCIPVSTRAGSYKLQVQQTSTCAASYSMQNFNWNQRLNVKCCEGNMNSQN